MSTPPSLLTGTPPSTPPSTPPLTRRKTPPAVPSTPLGTGGTSHSKALGTPMPKDTSSSASSGPGILAPVWERGERVVAAVTPGKERMESVKGSFQNASDAVGGALGFDVPTRRKEREDENEAKAKSDSETTSDSETSLEPEVSTWSNWNYLNPAYYLGWKK